jgi:addiction module RelB/DinJ family antitoxin
MCLSMAQININIDDNLKEQGEILFKSLGLNFSSAVNAFVSQAVKKQAVPFSLEFTDNDELKARKQFAETMRSIQEQSVANGTDNLTMDEITFSR